MWLVVQGLRWGEVTGLRVADVDFLRRTVSVSQQMARGKGGRSVLTPPKSDAGNREMSIPTELAGLLSTRMANLGLTAAVPDALLFPRQDGGPLD